jgi:hypothetical protein
VPFNRGHLPTPSRLFSRESSTIGKVPVTKCPFPRSDRIFVRLLPISHRIGECLLHRQCGNALAPPWVDLSRDQANFQAQGTNAECGHLGRRLFRCNMPPASRKRRPRQKTGGRRQDKKSKRQRYSACRGVGLVGTVRTSISLDAASCPRSRACACRVKLVTPATTIRSGTRNQQMDNNLSWL